MGIEIGTAALITGLLGAGASTASALTNRGKTNTSTSSSAPVYTQDQTDIQGKLNAAIQNKLNNPANLDPLKTQAINGVNQTYAGLSDRLDTRLAARGFGSSGKVVTGQKQLELSRAGDLAGIESKFAGLQLDDENRTFDLANKFAFASPGNNSSGTSTTPGNAFGAGIGSGVDSISTLFFLNQILKGKGGGLFGGGDSGASGNDLGGF